MMFFAIARKEFREAIRDRRSLTSGLLYGLWGPLVMGMALIAMAGRQGDIGSVTVQAEGASQAPGLVAFLGSRDVTVTEAAGDLAAAVRDRRVPIGLIVRADYPRQVHHQPPGAGGTAA
jgi:sodium transport system permease protein